jgi:hypothetical protein
LFGWIHWSIVSVVLRPLEGLLAIGPWEQLVDVAVRMTVDDPGQDVGEIGKRIDVFELAGLGQGGDDRPVFGSAVGPGKERVLAIELDATD